MILIGYITQRSQDVLWQDRSTDNINGKAKPNTSDFETALKSKYSELFKDEGHVIVCFMESSPSVYATYYWAGSAAKGVIDDEATRMMKVGRTTKQYIILAVAVIAGLNKYNKEN